MDNIKRIGQLMAIQLKKDWGFLLVVWGILGAIRPFATVFSIEGLLTLEFFLGISQLIYLGRIFSEFSGSKEAGMSYLTLPANNWEKYLSKYLFSAPVVLTGGVLALLLVDLLTASFTWFVFGDFLFTGIVTADLWSTVFNLFLGHAVLFTGALYFKKNANFKTVGLLMATIIGGFILMAVGMRLLYGHENMEAFERLFPEGDGTLDFDQIFYILTHKGSNVLKILGSPWLQVLEFVDQAFKFILNFLLLPFLLLLSYWKFTEKEAL